MIWQDAVLGGGGLGFLLALFPSLLSGDKPAIATSIATGSILIAYTAAEASLGLYFAAVTSAITAICWFVLAVQKAAQRPGTRASGFKPRLVWVCMLIGHRWHEMGLGTTWTNHRYCERCGAKENYSAGQWEREE